jgi:glycosyltransferase involved in cell wall biosynthesis
MIAPPWIPVPPRAYGGVERVIDLITTGLTGRGHQVTLFAAPGTESDADVLPVLEAAHPDEIQIALYDADHTASAFDHIEEATGRGEPFDVVHDHSGFTAFAFAHRLSTPLVQTLHGPFTTEVRAFYARHGHKAWAVAISGYQARQAPDCLRVAGVVPNPVVVDDHPLVEHKAGYLLWVGRMNADKGPHRAIAAATRAEMPIILAGPVQTGQEEFFAAEVEPLLGRDGVRYVGAVGGDERIRLFAEASALLMPIQWPEPFGLVMAEAMACGTPVIAFPAGSAPEVVVDGETGFLVADETEMAEAVTWLDRIAPRRCRQHVRDHYDVDPVCAGYERAYALAAGSGRGEKRPGSG